jgi:hypothetical protein
MSRTINPEIAALGKSVEHLGQEIAETRASLDRLNKIVRADIRQTVWQSVALVISILIATVGGLAYQTSVLNKRFEQIERRRQEAAERFAARSELAERNLKTFLDRSERNRTKASADLKQEVREQRK